MRKTLCISLLLLSVHQLAAQVGISTTAPKAQLDIQANNSALPAPTDGLLVPRVNTFPTTNPSADQNGMLVFLSLVAGTNQPGFYYWDNSTALWVPLKGANGGTLDQAYDFGGPGLGKTITADAGAVLIGGTDGLVVTGTINSGAVAPSGAGTKMFWNPRKGAFRAGRISGTEWDDANIGTYSVVFGAYNIASGAGAVALGNSNFATGYLSSAFGNGNLASGSESMAFGNSNNATGTYSTAFGRANQASAAYATAFGNGSEASGSFATAFGQTSSATGSLATAFGFSNLANGNAATAYGRENVASGTSATAYGSGNSALSFGETALGIGATIYTATATGATQFRTANATDRLFVIGNAIDSNNNGIVDGAERRDALLILKNGLTRLPSATNAMIGAADGKAIVTKEFLINHGTGGTLNQAYDFGGAGLGKTITADAGAVLIDGTDGLISTGAFDVGAVVPSGNGVRMFWNPRKGALRAGFTHGPEWDNVNIGKGSVAFGEDTQATGENTTALGNDTVASGFNAIAFGFYSVASGDNATAFGDHTTSSGADATSFGNSSRATGGTATAFGSSTLATGFISTAFGRSTVASGENSTAFGNDTTASGISSSAFGEGTEATGVNATAFGRENTARSFGETVLGIGATTYNISTFGATQFRLANQTDRLFVIGNAIDLNNNSVIENTERRDAIVVLKNGNTGIGVSAPTQKLHVVGNVRIVDGNQGAGKVLTSDANGTATWNTFSATNAWGLGGNIGTNPSTNYIGTSDNNHFSLRTNGVERARMLNTGEFGIGTNTPDAKFEVSGNGTQYTRLTNTTNGIVGLELKRGGGGSDWQVRNDGGEIMIGQSNDDFATVADVVRIGGSSFTTVTDNATQLGQNARRWISVHATNGIIQTSDANDKKQMIPLTSGMAKINSLRPISFQWKDHNIDQSATHLGFVAQEVQKVLPEVIVDHDWEDLPEGQGKVWKKTQRLGMKYAEIIPVLVKAFQEQQAIIDSQKRTNDALQAKLDAQTQILTQIQQRLTLIESKTTAN